MLLSSSDSAASDPSVARGKLRYVAPGHLTADLLAGPGRKLQQGDVPLGWEQSNETCLTSLTRARSALSAPLSAGRQTAPSLASNSVPGDDHGPSTAPYVDTGSLA